MSKPTFIPMQKIPRLHKGWTATEKLDGTNGCIFVDEDGTVHAASRKRWITPEDDNFGFAAWVQEHVDELRGLGPGCHFGEWWGKGIQRGYGLDHRRFSLFNVAKWGESRPTCCHVVPVLETGQSADDVLRSAQGMLLQGGSVARPGYDKPEGIVLRHHDGAIFKWTFDGDQPKTAEKTAEIGA